MISDMSKLVEQITASAVPGWLREYVDKHKNEIIFDLNLFGTHAIPTPDGGRIIVDRANK
jgi:hypothetical protein